MSRSSSKTFQPDYTNPPKIIAGELETVSVERLRNHPDNARKGDIEEIANSIKENGFYGRLMVQRSTGYIVSGNHRFLAGVQCGMYRFPVEWVDLTDEEALRILAVDNATSDKASYHEEKQVALLAKLAEMGKGLQGSGYEQKHLDALKDRLIKAKERRDESAQKKANKGDGDDRWAILIICDDPDDQAGKYQQLEELGLSPRRTVLNERTKLALG